MDIKPDKRRYPSSKLDQETINKILAHISNGVPYKHSAEAEGVAYSTFKSWVAQGGCDLEHYKSTIYTQLVASLRQIEIFNISNCIRDIRESEKGHKGKEWVLEHVFFKYFGARAGEIEFAERIEALESKQRNQNQVQGADAKNGEIDHTEAKQNTKI